MQLRALIADERGLSLPEVLVTTLLSGILLVSLGSFLVGSMRTGAFTEGQGATINDVRNVMQNIEKEVRGAEHLGWCEPAGKCIELTVESRIAPYPLRQTRYIHSGNELLRQERTQDADTSQWGDWGVPQVAIQRVQNSPEQPLFACDTQSTFLRVTVDLHIEPTPQSDPTMNIRTSLRPRNFPSVATCP